MIMARSIVFCDIYGTFLKNTPKDVDKFVNHLLNLDENDEMVFSFITTDRIDTVKQCMEQLDDYFDGTKIRFGYQYVEDRKYLNDSVEMTSKGKMSQILDELKANKYDKVYYFDDSSLNVVLFDLTVLRFPDTDFISVCHSKNHTSNLDGLNKAIEELIITNTSNKTKRKQG